ncbi:nicotinamide riboside transporter PnuC [Okibacterium endophyticum]
MNPVDWLFDAQLVIGDQVILWREVIGNVFGLLSALGGMRRKVWAWPVGIVGNVLLFTVFVGAIFDTPNPVNLLGQAGRQIMFVIVSVYGWMQWRRSRHVPGGTAVTPRWASNRTRVLLVVVLVGGTLALTPLFRALGSYEPVWADAWIFVGSLLATYGMAKGWTEFWLIWVAVDIVGVPLLVGAGYYASAAMYVFYGAFTLIGFVVWARTQRRDRVSIETAFPDPVVRRHGAADASQGADASRGAEETHKTDGATQ